MWAWDASLSAQGTTKELHSGREQASAIPPDAPNLSGTVSHDQEVYLFVTNGTLTVPRLMGTGWSLYTGPGTRLSASSLETQGTAGTLVVGDKSLDLRSSSLKVDGNTQAVLAGRGVSTPFLARLTGSPSQVVVGNTPLLNSATPARHAWPWVGLLGAVAVPVLAVPLLRLRRRTPSSARTQRLEEHADDLINRRRFKEALPLCLKILDWQPENPNAHYRLGKLLRHIDPPQAAQHHDQARQLLEPLAGEATLLGENWVETACALALLHAKAAPTDRPPLQERILACMEEAVAADAGLQAELEARPELRPFLPA